MITNYTNKIIKVLLSTFLFVAISLGTNNAFAQVVDTKSEFDYYAEKIQSFDVDIKINKDATIDVSEKIVYDFGNLDKHGIYRYIPYKYKARGGNFSLRFSDWSVSDGSGEGNEYQYDVSKQGDNTYIKIGDPDVLVSGVKTYIINYKVNRALNYFDEWDELYWNVTGNGWEVPIEKTSVTIEHDANVDKSTWKNKCFTGGYGSTSEDCSFEVLSSNSVKFTSGVGLYPAEGFTITLGWPKGLVSEPSILTKIGWILWDNASLFLSPLAFLFAFLYWRRKGKDPKINGAIVAEYEAPDNLSPVELATLTKDKVQNKYITSQLISLAIGGYLKIKQTGKGKKDYQFIYTGKDYTNLSNSFDKKLLEHLFNGKSKVDMADLENKFFKNLPEIKKVGYQSLTNNKYYDKNPETARFGLLFILGVMALLGSFVLGSVFESFMLGASIFVSGVIFIVFSMFMPRRTEAGTDTLRRILGFKEFLKVTEEERLKFHNPPEMIPALFEKFLPYAMVLGVETAWAKKFADIYNQPPDWYEGYQPGVWNAMYLTNSMSDFSTRSSNIMASTPSSSASGGSGFSGGGVGGGGGGGGGGSW